MRTIKDFLKRFFLPRFFDRYGQHIMEYTLVLTLVIAAVITMGPYVIRAWNANLQGWEDSAQDSMKDPLVEAPNDIQLPYCECSDWFDNGCGGGTSCLGTQRFWSRMCTPAGCANPEKCEYDDVCCIYYNPLGCGVNGTPPCPDGKMRITEECGDNGPHPFCQDDPSCVFICENDFSGYQYGDQCTGDDVGLSASMVWVAVAETTGCDDTRKCQWQCAHGFEPSSGGALCTCPTTYYDSGSACLCDYQYGYAEHGSCGSGGCAQGSCGAGQCYDRAL